MSPSQQDTRRSSLLLCLHLKSQGIKFTPLNLNLLHGYEKAVGIKRSSKNQLTFISIIQLGLDLRSRNPKLGMVKKGERNSENMATEARYPKLATPNADLLLALSFGVYEK